MEHSVNSAESNVEEQHSESVQSPTVSEEQISSEKLTEIIKSQSQQTLLLVDIANAYTAENNLLKYHLKKLSVEKDELLSSMKLQLILFVLLALIFWIFVKN